MRMSGRSFGCGEPVPFVVEGRDLVFDTQADAVYELEESDEVSK